MQRNCCAISNSFQKVRNCHLRLDLTDDGKKTLVLVRTYKLETAACCFTMKRRGSTVVVRTRYMHINNDNKQKNIINNNIMLFEYENCFYLAYVCCIRVAIRRYSITVISWNRRFGATIFPLRAL